MKTAMMQSARRQAKGANSPDAFLAIAPRADMAALEHGFAVAIAREGFRSHAVDAPLRDGGMVTHPAVEPDAGAPGCFRLLLPVQAWSGEWTMIVAAGHEGAIDRARQARMHLLAVVYAERRDTLMAEARDLATAVPLTLVERQLFGLLLTGGTIGDVAPRLDRSPRAIDLHLMRAAARLGVADPAEAVALAARRGWLLPLMPRYGMIPKRRD